MSIPLPTDQQPRLLLVRSMDPYDGEFADILDKFIRTEFPNIHIDHATSIEQALIRLNEHHYRWLIIWELVAETEGISVVCNLKNRIESEPGGNGYRFAKSWVDGHPHRHAFIFTNSVWESLHFQARMSGIPGCRFAEFRHTISEFILASESGQTFVPPTIIKVIFRQSGKDTCLILDEVEGPLKVGIEEAIRGRKKRQRPQERIANTATLRQSYWEAVHADLVTRPIDKLIEQLSAQLAQHGLLQQLAEQVHYITRNSFGLLNPLETINGPYPFHLHIYCTTEMLDIPIDLAVVGNDLKMNLCKILPVTWRVYAQCCHQHSDEDRSWNPTSREDIRILYSCEDNVKAEVNGTSYHFSKISHVKEHTDTIAAGLETKQPVTSIQTICQLRNSILASEEKTRHAIYLVSHGLHVAKQSGIILGPVPGDVNTGVCAGSSHLLLRPQEDYGPRFAYLNCCELAMQDDLRDIAGFADGIFMRGICAEAICNRWTVMAKPAFNLAREFYFPHPHTAHGRAAALLRARRVIMPNIGEKADDVYDHSLLAPIHIWPTPSIT